MRQDLRRFRSALLLILAFSLGLGAQLLQAQVSVTPGRYRFGATIAPTVNDGAALGTAALSWSDLFLASGAVINVGNGELTLTATDANILTLAGGQFIAPSGSAALPSLGVGASDTGFYAPSGGLGVSVQGSEWARFTADFQLAGRLMWGSSMGSVDSWIVRESAAFFQLGNDGAAPIAQTLKGPDARAGTDTDTVGGNITFAAGRGTGTGNPGNIYFQTGATNTPGTGAGPLTTRLQIASSGVTIIASHTRFNVASSTTGTNTPVFSANAPIGQTAPYVWIAVIASDGTAAWVPAWR